jgi:hypothetical protein
VSVEDRAALFAAQQSQRCRAERRAGIRAAALPPSGRVHVRHFFHPILGAMPASADT